MYAVWKEDSYTVKYNANGAAGEEILQYGKPGCGIRLIENTYVRSGYKFSGWATTKDGIVLYKNAQEILTDLAEKNRTVILYAVWEDTHRFTIKFNSNGGSGSMSNQSALNNTKFKLSKCRFSRTDIHLQAGQKQQMEQLYIMMNKALIRSLRRQVEL